MKNKSHKTIFLRLFCISALFLTLLISLLSYLQSNYFISNYINQNKISFQLKVDRIREELEGKTVVNNEIAELLGSLFEEYGSYCALFHVPNSGNSGIDYITNRGKGNAFDEILKLSKSLAFTMFDNPEAKPQFKSVKIGGITYFVSTARVTINKEDFVLGVVSSMQSIDEVVMALKGVSWFVYTATIIVSLGLAAVISVLIAKPLIREAEHERKLERIQKDFIMNASHEIKTPISIISGYAETLMDGFLTDTERIEYERGILEEANRMANLTKSLLTISMLKEDKQGSENVVDLRKSIQYAVDRFHLLFEKKSIEISTETKDDLVISFDETQIDIVLSNLISNAISHTPEHGRITIICNRQENGVRFEIENDGDPIPVESLEHIWESFYRVDKAHGRDEGRFGLGLYIIRTIIEKYGGTVIAENTKSGVKFSFSLPV